MGIKTEQFDKIKNLEKLTQEDKKALLEDTQRAGFNPALHQVRVMFDLINAIEDLDKNNSKLSKKIYYLTWAVVVLTLIMVLASILMIFK